MANVQASAGLVSAATTTETRPRELPTVGGSRPRRNFQRPRDVVRGVPRFVIRFAPTAGDPHSRYLCPHPDAPHGDRTGAPIWAMSAPGDIQAATTFADYRLARIVVAYDLGGRSREAAAWGHHAEIRVLQEETRALGLGEWAQDAMADLRAYAERER